MSGKVSFLIMGLVLAALCLGACGKKQTENPYGSLIAGLGDEEAYAFLTMDHEYFVCVTSDMVRDGGDGRQVSAACQVYYYAEGEVKNLGTVAGRGRAYPVSFSRDGIYAASEDSVEKYAVSEKEGILRLEKGVYRAVDSLSGSPCFTKMENGIRNEAEEDEYQELRKEYSRSQMIHFAFGASECLNEIIEW